MNIIKKYSNFVSRHPFLIVLGVVLFTIFMLAQFGNMRFENQDNSDMLPSGNAIIDEFEYINNQFAGTETVQILIKLEPSVMTSTQPRDIRSYEIINYLDLVGKKIELLEDVRSVDSPATLISSMNNNTIPQSDREIKKLSAGLTGYVISDDYNSALLRISLEGDVDAHELERELREIIETTPKPSKVELFMSGQVIQDVVMEGLFQSDMGKTGNLALLGIFIVILFIFRSLKYGLTPLTTIIFANIWSMGFLGLIDMPITSVMTGVSSMIMGIGIDFGIQVVYRFRYEMKDKNPEEAMAYTLSNVIVPMSTTTIAALIGFRAMSLGELTMMSDIGTMMTYGVLFSMVAALTFVPATLLIGEKYRIRDYAKKFIKNKKKTKRGSKK